MNVQSTLSWLLDVKDVEVLDVEGVGICPSSKNNVVKNKDYSLYSGEVFTVRSLVQINKFIEIYYDRMGCCLLSFIVCIKTKLLKIV
jgi:hypothetical protein